MNALAKLKAKVAAWLAAPKAPKSKAPPAKLRTKKPLGVSLQKRSGLWIARIYRKGVHVNLGCYATKEQALVARRLAERALANGISIVAVRDAAVTKRTRNKGRVPRHVVGVTLQKATGRWRAQYNGKTIGMFGTHSEAVAVRKMAEKFATKGTVPDSAFKAKVLAALS